MSNPPSKRIELREGDGFVARVTPSGSVTFGYVYMQAGKRYRVTLGSYPNTTLALARQNHEALRAKVRAGIDVHSEWLAEVEAKRQAPSVAEAVVDYLESRKGLRSVKQYERFLRVEVLPRVGGVKVRDLKRAHIQRVVDEIVEGGSPYSALQTLLVVGAFLNWCLKRELVEFNVASGIEKPARIKPRDVFLRLDEIAPFWKRLEGGRVAEPVRLALLLCLVTGCRPGEAANLEWRAIDWQRAEWQRRADDLKGKRSHTLPLSPVAMALLRRAWKLSGGRGPFVFPRQDGRPITGEAMRRALAGDVFRFTSGRIVPRDLRTTAGTSMRALGVSRFDVGQVLAHAERSVTGTFYDMWSNLPEMRAALDKWSSWLCENVPGLAEAVEPEGVTSLASKRPGGAA